MDEEDKLIERLMENDNDEVFVVLGSKTRRFATPPVTRERMQQHLKEWRSRIDFATSLKKLQADGEALVLMPFSVDGQRFTPDDNR